MTEQRTPEEIEYTKQVAQTILQQLGGKRFVMMTGAKDFVAMHVGDNPALRFKIPGNMTKGGVNMVQISLNGGDLYDVEFFRVRKTKTRGTSVASVQVHNDIFCDMLEDVFERATGLYTRL